MRIKLSFEKKITLSFIVALITILFVIFVFLNYARKMEKTNGFVYSSQEVLRQNEAILISILELENGSKGYIITGDHIHIENQNESQSNLMENVSKLRALSKGNRNQQLRIDSLKLNVIERIAITKNTNILRKYDGFDETKKLIYLTKGKNLSDKLIKIINSINDTELKILKQRKTESDTSRSSFEKGLILLIFSIGLIFAFTTLITFKNQKARRIAEEKLKESLKETSDYKYAINQSSIVAITDQKGIIKSANENFCKISKYSESELIGQDHNIVNSGFHSKEFIKAIWTTIANGKVWKGEFKNKAKDGTYYWVDTIIVPFLNEENKPFQYIAIRQDITLRKEQEELLKLQTAELKQINEELETFSYSVSHDLKAPLRSLQGFANALLENYKGKFDEDGERWLNYITDNANRMGVLISDILNFSRVSRSNVVKVKVNMKQLAQENFTNESLNYSEKTINFNLENIDECFGDTAMFRQVWQNLISNAIKYSSKNETINITIKSIAENNFMIYSVKDDGAGFDEKYKEKLFAIFQRLHTNKEFEGTGVGLAIVHRIIQKHNGWITASSELGKGSEFTFAIPILNSNI